MNKIKFILLFTFIASHFYAESLSITTPSPKIETALQKLYLLPGFKNFLMNIEKEGFISIEMKPLPNETFDAFWDSTNRKIRINSLKNEKLETLACSILFELHNAKTDRQFMALYQKVERGKISKSAYVEGVEKMEHQNALDCSLFLERGIDLGIFSEKAAWPILHDFDDHYKLQQIMGHSAWISKNYETIAPVKNSPYYGTLPNLSAEKKEDFLRYLKIKKNLESKKIHLNTEGLIALQKEYEKALGHQESFYLLRLVFHKENVYQALVEAFSS